MSESDNPSGQPNVTAADDEAAASADAGARAANADWGAADDADELAPGEKLNVDVSGFEGPLDLLLALARTQKVDLAHISVTQLAEQYLAFIADVQKVRLELAADYLVMAAWLAYLKSRLLLPKEKKVEDGPSADEMAALLAFRLQRLDAMRKAAAQLFTRKRLGQDIFPRGMPEGVRTFRERQYSAEIFDLLKAYADQRKRTTVKRAHVVKRRVVWSIKDARQRLEQLVGVDSKERWVQLDLFIERYLPAPELGRTALASAFGATLEMTREGLIEIRQAGPFAPIYMRRKEPGAEWQRVS
ncbi:MAG: ScpA family protein [Hyphomicrobiaceae bacterium]